MDFNKCNTVKNTKKTLSSPTELFLTLGLHIFHTIVVTWSKEQQATKAMPHAMTNKDIIGRNDINQKQ